jgi:hypothetical protein
MTNICIRHLLGEATIEILLELRRINLILIIFFPFSVLATFFSDNIPVQDCLETTCDF